MLDLLELLGSADSLTAFHRATMEAGRLIPGEKRRFSEVAPDSGVETVRAGHTCCTTPEFATAVQRLGAEHPAMSHARASGDTSPVAISRLVSEPAFRSSALYRELYRWVGLADELVIPIPHDVLPARLAIGRTTWGFGDDELALAAQLQRVLTMTYAWHRDREVIRAGAPMAERMAQEQGRELLVSHPCGDLRRLDGSPVVIDEAVRAAIQDATRLAGRVRGQAEPGGALVEVASVSPDGGPFTLRVHAPDAAGDLLPITLERPRAAVTADELARHGLTPRQVEVMTLVLNGSTNGGAANELGISERTVEKHVLAAYDKLGVRTRTTALLAVLK